MNELALFAGAGGGILGGKLLGWRTVCAVENEPYAISVLLQRQNDKVFPTFPIWDDICTFDGRPWQGIVDVVSGGFPCQDISAAGKGEGIKGKRSGLWSEMARVIGEVKPKWVFAENSPMLVSRGLNIVLSDLAQMGFDAKWGCISAAEVGANHKRDRIWIVAKNMAYTRCKHGSQRNSGELDKDKAIRSSGTVHNQSSSQGFFEDVADTIEQRSQGRLSRRSDSERQSESGHTGCSSSIHRQQTENWWSTEPNVGRVVNGMAARAHRLKAIGNGQVPEVAKTAWQILSK